MPLYGYRLTSTHTSENEQLMRLITSVSILIVLLFSSACEPTDRVFSKASYLEGYNSFIHNVKRDHMGYNKDDWEKMDERYRQYSRTLYSKYEHQLTQADNDRISAYKRAYWMCKATDKGSDFMDDVEDGILNALNRLGS